MDFQLIQKNCIATCEVKKAIEDKIVMREKQIERLNKKLRKNRAWWGDVLIRPIMEAVKEKYPDLTWDDERLIPMGLRCAVSVFGYVGEMKTENVVVGITFTPGVTEEGGIYIDTGETGTIKPIYPANSIGGLNGFGNVTKLVTSLEDVYSHIDTCIERNEEKLTK
jgi:hypothetical protein